MIYNTIKDVAANQGISIYRIEKDLEFPNGLISKWNKSTPSASNLAKVAKYLGVTTEKLLGDGSRIQGLWPLAGLVSTTLGITLMKTVRWSLVGLSIS